MTPVDVAGLTSAGEGMENSHPLQYTISSGRKYGLIISVSSSDAQVVAASLPETMWPLTRAYRSPRSPRALLSSTLSAVIDNGIQKLRVLLSCRAQGTAVIKTAVSFMAITKSTSSQAQPRSLDVSFFELVACRGGDSVVKLKDRGVMDGLLRDKAGVLGAVRERGQATVSVSAAQNTASTAAPAHRDATKEPRQRSPPMQQATAVKRRWPPDNEVGTAGTANLHAPCSNCSGHGACVAVGVALTAMAGRGDARFSSFMGGLGPVGGAAGTRGRQGAQKFGCKCDFGYYGEVCAFTCPGGAKTPCHLKGVCHPKLG